MTHASPTTISSGDAAANAAGPPTRESFEGAPRRWLKRGGPTKADVSAVDLGQGEIVIKDFADKAWWVRCMGRLQIARECRAYRRLQGMSWLPRWIGRVDAHAFALERIEGVELAFQPDRRERGVETHARLIEIVHEMHRAGVVHLDLRGKENVLIGSTGQLYVFDLASAVCFRPGGVLDRLAGNWLRMTDEAALLKWKRILGALPYSEEEQAFLDRYRFWRRLWIFNRKGRGRG